MKRIINERIKTDLYVQEFLQPSRRRPGRASCCLNTDHIRVKHYHCSKGEHISVLSLLQVGFSCGCEDKTAKRSRSNCTEFTTMSSLYYTVLQDVDGNSDLTQESV